MKTQASGVVNVWFYKGGGERLRWWTSEVVNVWGGERLGWWTSDFTQGVVNVWGGECLGGERLTIYLDEGYMSKVEQVNSSAVVLLLKFYNLQTPILIERAVL